MIQKHHLKHFILFIIIFATTLSASTLYVDNNSSDGTWSGAYTDLQTALAATSYGDQVWVAAGTYHPTSGTDRNISFNIPQAVKVYGGFIGGEAALDSRDWENNVTILSGDIGSSGSSADNSYSVVRFTNVSNQTVVDGFTICDGHGSNGGGIYIDGGGAGHSCSPQLINLTISNNYVTGNGGGIYLYAENSGNASPVLTNCNISSNEAQNGAGLYLHGGSNGSANPSIDRCLISGNFSAQKGGGLYLYPQYNGDCKPQISNTLLSGNKAQNSGGAIYNYAWDGGEAEPTLRNCTISGNASAYGGAISSWLSNGGQARYYVYNTIIWGNETSNGGQVRISESGVETYNLPYYSYCLLEGSSSSSWDASYGPTTGTYCIDDNPDFVSRIAYSSAPTTSGDYQLMISSPALGKGSTNYDQGIYDLNGADRVSNLTLEIGAYEKVVNDLFVDADAHGNYDGSSWEDAYTSLYLALLNTQPGIEIWVAEGTYKPSTSTYRSRTFTIPANCQVYGGFNGTESLLSERDPENNITILSGDIGMIGNNSDNSYHVVTFNSTPLLSPNTVIDGFTITKGNADVFNGGGIYVGDLNYQYLYIENCIITDNSATNGGGVYADSEGSVNLRGCTINDNSATNGGGVYANSYGTVNFTECTISSNTAAENGGGAAFYYRTIGLTQSKVSGNTASLAGGGIYCNNSWRLRITSSVLSGNSANASSTYGNGLYMCYASSYLVMPNIPIILNSTIAANSNCGISSIGGTSSAPFYLINSIVYGNTISGTLNSSYIINSNVQGRSGEQSIVRNPVFYDAPDASSAPTTAGDFRLRSTSPCIGSASAADAPATDIENNARNGDPDMGAYEASQEFRTTRMYVDTDATGEESGESWDAAFVKLQDAITAAVAGDEIWVAEGTYYPDDGEYLTEGDNYSQFRIPSGIKLYGGFTGREASLPERNWTENETIMSGDMGVLGDKSDNAGYTGLVNMGGANNETLLDGFTVRDAYHGGDETAGIYINYSNAIIRNCKVTGNETALGAIYIYRGSPIIERTVVSGNKATSTNGTIYSVGSGYSPQLNYCTIIGNFAERGSALHIDNGNSDIFAVNNSIIWNNTRAGGIISYVNGANAAFANSIVEDSPSSNWNPAYGTDGGNNRSFDPQLTLLSDTSAAPTHTGDFTPLYNSTCIEAGDSTFTYDESGNHAYGWKTDIGAIEYTGTRVAQAIDGPGEYLFGGDVRMKVNVTADNLDSLDITVHPGEAHAENNTLLDRWYDVRTVGTGTFDLTFSYLHSELNDESEEALKVYRYADNSWSAPLTITGSNTGDNWVTISNQTAGGQFTMGGEQTDSSLPVTLSEFKAEIHDKTVEIIWATDSEIENLGFILERRMVSEMSPFDGLPACCGTSDRETGQGEERSSTGSGRHSSSGGQNSSPNSTDRHPELVEGWQEIASYQTHAELEGAGSSNTRSIYAFTDDSIEPGVIYEYRLADVSYSGEIVYHTMTLTDVMIEQLPENYALFQNYPNPFNPSTTIRYGLLEEANVSLVIYDVRGHVVQTLKSGHQSAGWYDVVWNGQTAEGKSISTGIYFARLVAGDYRQVVKMLCLK